MRFNYTIGSVVCILLAIPLVVYVLNRNQPPQVGLRVATFNLALNRPAAGELAAELRGGAHREARQLAEIVQRSAVDVLLLCELDWDADGAALRSFCDEYLAVSQNGQPPIAFEFRYLAPVNTGEPSGRDLDGDGRSDGPADAFGYGRFPGQYGMAIVSRYPILTDRVRTFRELRWSAMPAALRPDGYDDATWAMLRLSSKSHWDVPIGVGSPDAGKVVHLLASHPTPPVFDGPEDRNGKRNHDEVRFWVDYLTPGRDGWIVDDAGRQGGLAADASFVVLGDLNCDPVDGDARREALLALLALPRVQDPRPRSGGGVEQSERQWGANSVQQGQAELDTADFDDAPPHGPGNLRVDYVLPSRNLRVFGSGVFWPRTNEPGHGLVAASDHRLVWVDLSPW